MPKTLLPGIYAPTQVFYADGKDETLDDKVIRKHAVRLARAGVAGIVTNGSNGEAVYLSPEERHQVTKSTRDALDSAGFSHLPVIVGASDQSIQGTLRLCRDAADAGGDAVLLMVPSFFKWAMNGATIDKFFTQVADESPLPLIIYNYPGAVAGIDLDSDQLISLAKHPNIIGTKFTCGSVGKLARVAEATSPVSEVFSSASEPYFAFAGVADFISASVEVGASGAIVGAANVFPRACVNVYNLAVQGKREEAMRAQQSLAKADWELTKRAIPGFKVILSRWNGYGGIPRGPMASLDKAESDRLVEDVAWMMDIEEKLEDFGV
ncbi:L-threo-3-deoxy-hexylosonate aldolase [Neonectria ditissima]|uniref:L-threo-3-deoxy-hexylosonate aldolase n=1 Tax=Neonectria ditissima TaxID=78410 RepID=A0A0P7AW87_9HYPO|nr:L-threo-3-deoxy-hexylosonate aldolase [Neonectria ditissima]